MAMGFSAEIAENFIFFVFVFVVTLEAVGLGVKLLIIVKLSVLETFSFLPDFFRLVFENEMWLLQHSVVVVFHLLNIKNSISVIIHPNYIGIRELLKSNIINIKHLSTLYHQSELISVSLVNSFVIDSLQLAKCEFVRIVLPIK